MADQSLEATQLPSAVKLELNGMPCLFVELPAEMFPAGSRVTITRVGDLAPLEDGVLGPGASLLIIPPQVVQAIHGFAGAAIRAARQGAAQPSPLLRGH